MIIVGDKISHHACATSKFFNGILVGIALTLFSAHSAKAQGYVSFDAADSDFGAGLYYFDLAGVTIVSAGIPGIQLSVGSPFAFSNFAAIGNTDALGAISSPSGWHSLPSPDADEVLYQLNQLSWVYNGTFVISATPDLSGTINWSFGSLGGPSLSGTVDISPVPEPATLGLFGFGVILFMIRMNRRTTNV